MINIRTDLAVEAREMYKKDNNTEVPGVEVDVKKPYEDVSVTVVEIKDERGAKIMGKEIGRYVTIEVPGIKHYDAEAHDKISEVLAKELENMIGIKDGDTVLVAGLGNWNVTPDALGPKVVSKLLITRHLKQLMPEHIDEGINPVCAIAPGVLGLTGIETAEIIQGVISKVKPNYVIAIDALASRKMERVASTIQIGNTGIGPGSGVGNKRMALNKDTLGVPVIAIGVPTVVDAATMANDTIDMIIDELIKQSKDNKDFYDIVKKVDKNEKYILIREILSPYISDLMVTPKEIDALIDDMSKIIANSINLALHPSLDKEDLNKYLQ
ncbi:MULTISPECIES: GPR endopeptidase [Caloramator]|uniref:Germination protease n=1 Tax=Caloramator proteoclasticus DSM 10124 TaxID=1121262 RepID=A0A1M4WYR4_9CLOT|nr:MULTISPECIES: GPR endopeptidase [Caloramator]SHE86345.1 spore protease [Caloramator proteoclasticus DSM 10124]